uniref:Putative secreted protein n=1 Tax=Xenopsylla cheopis TaxID=163159 RepID=A0A6M2DZ76_XENCH
MTSFYFPKLFYPLLPYLAFRLSVPGISSSHLCRQLTEFFLPIHFRPSIFIASCSKQSLLRICRIQLTFFMIKVSNMVLSS